MSENETIDGTAVEEPDRTRGRELALVRRHEVLRPLDVTEQVQAMRAYQEGLRALLDPSDWQSAGRERFVKKSGWRKIAAWFDLTIEQVREGVDRDETGAPIRAFTVARAIAPSGRHADGDGYCSVEEDRFAEARGRKKLENDLRSTATTRAVNRAVSNLVGMGAVSAEEIDAGPRERYGPAYRRAGDEGLAEQALAALVGDEHIARKLWQDITRGCGYMPEVVATALARALRARAYAQQQAANGAASGREERTASAAGETAHGEGQPVAIAHVPMTPGQRPVAS
jgi:hypothetical protein